MARATRTKQAPAAAGPGNTVESVPETLGARIRQERLAAGFSVRGLAARTSVSPSLISQIELGRATPSVATLWAVATELGISIGDLFNGGEPAPRSALAPSESPVQRHGTRKAIALAGGVRWERLTPGADHDVEFIHVVYPPGAESCPPDSLSRHGGREYGYVVGGTLGVQIGFESYVVHANDSVSFESAQPHRLWSIGNEPAVAIWMVVNRRGGGQPDAIRP
jgi:transcriptional regulator with XRE-family HTH domain